MFSVFFGVGFSVEGLGFRVKGLGPRFWGSGFGAQDFDFMVWSLGFRVHRVVILVHAEGERRRVVGSHLFQGRELRI